jgi:dienelactone hydrolase
MVLNFAKMGENLKGVVSFHGGLAGVPPTKDLLKSEILVCHGADDKFVSADEVSNFKKELDGVNAVYLFKEYPNATHAFSNPDATEMGKKFSIPIAYNEKADKASWNEMIVFLKRIFK